MMLLTLDAQWLALCLPSVCIIYLLTSRLYSKNTKLNRNFVSVCILVVLSFEVGQTSRSSISRPFMPKKKIAALQTSKAQSLLATPILSFLLKTLVNYKTSPWIQSLHTQKCLTKKFDKIQARNV
jgi:hypothetical protein